jgi:hypothetical protein
VQYKGQDVIISSEINHNHNKYHAVPMMLVTVRRKAYLLIFSQIYMNIDILGAA